VVGREIVWKGSGVNEKGVDRKSGEPLVEIDPRYFRPTEVELLLGDPSKAQEKLGWRHKTSFGELVREMVEADLVAMPREFGRRDRD
jgi:GDPmannose 4,6-dehydratase